MCVCVSVSVCVFACARALALVRACADKSSFYSFVYFFVLVWLDSVLAWDCCFACLWFFMVWFEILCFTLFFSMFVLLLLLS